MKNETFLAGELKKYEKICFYPSSGRDLSDLDFFGSGKKLWSERVEKAEFSKPLDVDFEIPDLFIHTDINFYMEFEEGKDLEANEWGLNDEFEIVSFRELPKIENPNRICDNYEFSGKCFEYKLKVWKNEKILTLIYCLCENEYFVSDILLPNSINVPIIWSKNWAGGLTSGTWLANVCDRLQTKKIYTDWLCVPGKRGQPLNTVVKDKYPSLMTEAKVKLVRNDKIRWIDETAHGWVEEFDVIPKSFTKAL